MVLKSAKYVKSSLYTWGKLLSNHAILREIMEEFAKNAHIVAVNMGYGHERPAQTLRSCAFDDRIYIANDYEGIPAQDKRIWESGRTWYERISRFKRVPVLGKAIFGIMDELQEIQPFYPRRDLSAPSLQVRQFYYLIRRKHHMRHLVEMLGRDARPLVSTFMSPAFAAEEFGYPEDIYLLVTDSDMSRAWCPLKPKQTRIKYLAPTGRVAERLQLYGVPEENIHLTGFPLPDSLIGGADSTIALENLQRRICHLDPHGIFTAHTGVALTAYVGEQYCKGIQQKNGKPIQLAFAVGGAGAQKEIGIEVAKGLRNALFEEKIILHLIAGSRPEVATYFYEELRRAGLQSAIQKQQIRILFKEDREVYFQEFARLMGEVDILWTKPSELSFYAGLGLPIIMAPTLGSQEDYNRAWLQQIGAGIDQLDPRYCGEWLMDWVESGALARAAWNGYIEAPTHGLHRIADIIAGRPNTIHPLPLIV